MATEAEHLFDTVALEGYLLGRFVIAVLERMEGEITRERFLSTALSPEPVTIKEAHSAETGLKRFVDGEIDRSGVLFTVEDATFRLADFATLSGIVSGGAFLLAALSAIVLLILFF